MDFMTHYAGSCGKLPRRYWYQLGGQSARENWMEQRRSISEDIAEQEDGAEIVLSFPSEANAK